MNVLDATDIRILQLLQHDAKITTKELADKLGKSITPVHERVRRLEETGYIKRYVALVDKDLIGKHLTAFTTVQLEKTSSAALRGFKRDVVQFPEVMECYHLSGKADFLLKVAIGDMKEYDNFLSNKLSTLANIGSLETFFVFSEQKVETAYPLAIVKKKAAK